MSPAIIELLALDHIESGPVQIAVTVTNYTSKINMLYVIPFLSFLCIVKRVLTGVSLRDKSLWVIESRDCIARPKN